MNSDSRYHTKMAARIIHLFMLSCLIFNSIQYNYFVVLLICPNCFVILDCSLGPQFLLENLFEGRGGEALTNMKRSQGPISEGGFPGD